MGKGKFITFEGIDGCGKSTQLAINARFLEERGQTPLIIREPGGTSIGEKIRTILLDKKNDEMCAITELLLYEAARAQITQEKIKPSLEQGNIVLCDRFFDSTFAYQGYARGLGTKVVESLNLLATEGLEPDLTFLFDITPEDAFKRRAARGESEDRLEAMGLGFQEEVRKGYLEALATVGSKRIKIIDASKSPEEIFETVKKYLLDEGQQ